MTECAPISRSPTPPAGLIFTKLSITECAPTTMRVPRRESSMSLSGETRAVVWISIMVGSCPSSGRGQQAEARAQVALAHHVQVARLLLLGARGEAGAAVADEQQRVAQALGRRLADEVHRAFGVLGQVVAGGRVDRADAHEAPHAAVQRRVLE